MPLNKNFNDSYNISQVISDIEDAKNLIKIVNDLGSEIPREIKDSLCKTAIDQLNDRQCDLEKIKDNLKKIDGD